MAEGGLLKELVVADTLLRRPGEVVCWVCEVSTDNMARATRKIFSSSLSRSVTIEGSISFPGVEL